MNSPASEGSSTAKGRVLIAINTSWNFVNFRAGLVRALVASGYEVIAAAPGDAYSTRLVDLGCRHVEVPMNGRGMSPAEDLLLLWRFWRLLRRERPDAFLGYTIKPNIYGSLAAHAHGIPVINNVSGLGVAFARNNWLTRLVKGLYRASLGRSGLVFFQNDDDRMLFVRERLVRAERTSLLPGSGVDLTAFRPRPRGALDNDRPCFLLVGRLLWSKGIGEYVEAARIVRRDFPGARFQLLGFLDPRDPALVDRNTIEEWVGEGLVEYLGGSDDVRVQIADADCVVLPSSYPEGTPRSLIEAAAMAKPLIASDMPGCREVVAHGENGFLCAPGNAEDLAGRMLDFARLAPDRRLAMGETSRAKAEREFDERIVIGRYLQALEALLSVPERKRAAERLADAV